jgi:hypothetical protein
MQKDFHFYAIGVLARAAGFGVHDALVIAHCSQYVDDASESEPIKIKIKNANIEFNFDPVRTAYDFLKPDQGFDSLGWSAQKRVHIPFHFIPPKPFTYTAPELPFSFVTQPHSYFAEFLVTNSSNAEHPIYQLCRMGVALHTYADTWAHQGFSGREYESENNVRNMQVRDPSDGQMKKLWLENLITDVPLFDIPEIGHAEALYLPDVGYHDWRCEIGPLHTPGGGNNVERFMEAAKYIYRRLRNIWKSTPGLTVDPIPWQGGTVDFLSWEELKPLIEARLSEAPEYEPGFFTGIKELLQKLDPEERCKKWEEEFSTWFEPPPSNSLLRFHYDREAFRNDALEGDTRWDNLSRREWQSHAPFTSQQTELPDFWTRPWIQFHRAALHQRHLVMERLP